jgi:hypothetical protein
MLCLRQFFQHESISSRFFNERRSVAGLFLLGRSYAAFAWVVMATVSNMSKTVFYGFRCPELV